MKHILGELPISFRHPRTGVIVMISPEGIQTYVGGYPGGLRSYRSMSDAFAYNHPAWSAMDEIGILRRAQWEQLGES